MGDSEPLRESFFPGNSEMARRMRALDWSATLLGPVERWPQPLLTSVGVCLDCAFPIVIWWGPELAILYNDEYRTILGAKDPSALGEPGAKVWAEIWDVIGPMLSQVVATGTATRSRDLQLNIDRQGYQEEAYFSFSYSPIHDETGKVGGIFCPVIETTDKVIGERRLRTLRDLAASGLGADREETVYRAAASVLKANLHDVPFSLIYRIDAEHSVAELQCSAGIVAGDEGAPRTVRLVDGDAGTWSLGDVARTGKASLMNDVATRFSHLPAGAWQSAPASVFALPILLPGQDQPRAVLVAAVSPMRALDEDYRTFFGLVATQIASGLADAQAKEAERQRAEALAEIDRAKTTFFSNVSHEFRTPLTLMVGPLDDLLTDPNGMPDEKRTMLNVVHRNSLRLLKLVNTLLEFARIEAGRFEASYEPTDLCALTKELASVFRSAIERAGLQLRVECEPLGEQVYVDRDMWEKIVLNLLSNAFKFTFEGAITVALRRRGSRVELSVADTGVGIRAAELPRMFERFHRVRNARSRTQEGTGIGLALVQELAKLHGGDVSVQSTEGAGTTFVVAIPMGRAHLPRERIGAPRTLASTGISATPYIEEALRWLPDSSDQGKGYTTTFDAHSGAAVPPANAADKGLERILIADDNADMRDYLRRLLSPGYAVKVAADGQEALEQIGAEVPDLVVTDVMMPRLDGFGLLAALRADEKTRSLPVIMLSARAGEEARIDGVNAGADAYLVKPFSARELVARIGSQLELSRLRRESEQELRRRNERIEESRAALEAADRRKNEFLATLAHELRNPLATISNTMHLLRMRGQRTEKFDDVRPMFERQVKHLVRLVDDLTDMSRITSGKIELRKERVDVGTVVHSALETASPLIEQQRHRLVVSLPEEPLAVDGDPVRLSQVFANVLNNAAKYTDERGDIFLTVRRIGADAVVSVRDSGIGIPAETLPSIFDLFVQGNQGDTRSRGGLGVGLTLARDLVRMHGGRIEAKSQGNGSGSEFVVTLPLAEAVDASLTEPPRADAPESRIGHRVLVVEDDADAAATLRMLLAMLGPEVRIASSGQSALQLMGSYRPTVVILDIGLPNMDGYEVARRMRAGTEGDKLMLVALSGWGQEGDRRRSREAGIDYHLVKPVDLRTLQELLANVGPLPRGSRIVSPAMHR